MKCLWMNTTVTRHWVRTIFSDAPFVLEHFAPIIFVPLAKINGGSSSKIEQTATKCKKGNPLEPILPSSTPVLPILSLWEEFSKGYLAIPKGKKCS